MGNIKDVYEGMFSDLPSFLRDDMIDDIDLARLTNASIAQEMLDNPEQYELIDFDYDDINLEEPDDA